MLYSSVVTLSATANSRLCGRFLLGSSNSEFADFTRSADFVNLGQRFQKFISSLLSSSSHSSASLSNFRLQILRLQTSDGMERVVLSGSAPTVADLQAAIAKQAKVPRASQRLTKRGAPELLEEPQ